ncbi:MAG TPA: LD-carboxypeptidase [Thermoanaerobaculia bacterium]|nr:LD-carboxypeptidase [Thermoanaerobaculia bacterium]
MPNAAFYPPPVRVGERVGVAALSGPVDPGRLEAGVAALAAMGYQVVAADNLASRRGYLAGSDDERLSAFHRLAGDPSIRAIFFARGGYGLTRLLERIDWGLLAAHPRPYFGYSDLTPFLEQVVHHLGMVAFHGAMAAADLARGLTAAEAAALAAALAGEPAPPLSLGGWVRSGRAEGPLAGGCLSLLAATAGTPFAPRLAGRMLFLEDTNEPLYRIDRMLTQLLGAGLLEGVSGVALGRFDPLPPDDPELLGLVLDRLAPLGAIPIAWGLPCGHSSPNLTLPVGACLRLEGREPVLAVVG